MELNKKRGSLKERGVTDLKQMASEIGSNPFFQEFVKDHQNFLDSTVEKQFGPNSGYGQNAKKNGTEPFKHRFAKFVHLNNAFRIQNLKLFSPVYQKELIPEIRKEGFKRGSTLTK